MNRISESAEIRSGSEEEPVELCDRCGYPLEEIHCKLFCRRCGYMRDCSDP